VSKAKACALGVMFASASLTMAQPVSGQSDPLAQGQQLYDENCAACHQPDGTGTPPTFPALAGNANLEDIDLIVTNIYHGKGNMPPFPALSAEQIAALATYLRSSWGNTFGEVAAEEVASILSGLETAGDQTSIWDGVYTAEQAERGAAAYISCTRCHGRRLNGAPDDPDQKSTPPLARAAFLREWDGKSLAVLFGYTRATMPLNNPASLSDQQYIDIIAYMLSINEAPAGDAELAPDPAGLGRIMIEDR
jgi:mono/diheme cytochrome c family protein